MSLKRRKLELAQLDKVIELLASRGPLEYQTIHAVSRAGVETDIIDLSDEGEAERIRIRDGGEYLSGYVDGGTGLTD